MIREPVKNLYRLSRYEITQCGFDFFLYFLFGGRGKVGLVWVGNDKAQWGGAESGLSSLPRALEMKECRPLSTRQALARWRRRRHGQFFERVLRPGAQRLRR